MVSIGIVDVETTGFSPKADRIVEIAALLVTPEGKVTDTFTTLVNPQRHVSASEIHGLTASLLSSAPAFPQVAPELAHFLSRAAVLAGHNVAFDLRMLEAEFLRSGQPFALRPHLCTMALAGGGRLDYCCALYGIDLERRTHAALEDALATARLLAALLRDNPFERQRISVLPPPECLPPAATPVSLLTRSQSVAAARRTPGFIASLLNAAERAGPYEGEGEADLAYEERLERALEDRRFSDQEAQALTDLAEALALRGEDVRAVHRRVLDRLARAHLSDDDLSSSEMSDLGEVARLLGLADELDDRIAEARRCPSEPSSPATGVLTSLAGLSVCFTGEIAQPFLGRSVTRIDVERLAADVGLVVKGVVTKKLDLLVCADAATESGKAKKARAYGNRVMHAAEFLRQLEPLVVAPERG